MAPKNTRTARKSVASKKKVNLVAVVLDTSGSMEGVRTEAMNMARNVVAGFSPTPDDQHTLISYFPFSINVRTEFTDVPADLAPGRMGSWWEGSSTYLYEAVGTAIDHLANSPYAKDPDTSFVVVIVTDGDNTNIRTFTEGQVQDLIRRTQATDRWTYVFHCPPNRRNTVCRTFGIPDGNVREWERTTRGMAEVVDTTRVGTQAFYSGRTKGIQATIGYLQPDLSKVKTTDVKRKLTDLSLHFKMFDVPQESRIDEFTERKTRRAYVRGQSFYLLQKPEKVQKDKEVVLTEVTGSPTSPTVWGGDEARAVIGLPRGSDAQVIPGNHAGWNIFIQSRAPNRKLPRGTKVLIDMTRTKDATPTWGDPAKFADSTT